MAYSFGVQGGTITGAHMQMYRGVVCATRTKAKAFFKMYSFDFLAGVEGYPTFQNTKYAGGKFRAGGIQLRASGTYHFFRTGGGEVSLYAGAGLQGGIRNYEQPSPLINTSAVNIGGSLKLGAEFLLARIFFTSRKEAYITLFAEGNLYNEFISHTPYSFTGGEVGVRINTWHWR